MKLTSLLIKQGNRGLTIFINNNKGFSFIEALIAIIVLTVAVLGLVSMQGTFATQSVDRTLQNALIDAASSALTHCQNVNTAPPGTYTYEGIAVTVSISGNCALALNTCSNVTATATASGRTFSMTTFVCNSR